MIVFKVSTKELKEYLHEHGVDGIDLCIGSRLRCLDDEIETMAEKYGALKVIVQGE